MLKKRALSFLAAVLITAAVTFAFVQTDSMQFPAGSIEEGVIYETTGVCPDTIVVTAAEKNAPLDLYAYWLQYDASYVENFLQYYQGAEMDWNRELTDGQTVESYLREDVVNVVKQQLVVEKLVEQYGVGLSEAQTQEMADSRAQFVEYYGGEEGYQAELAKLGLSEETYQRITASNYYYNNLYELYVTEGSVLYADDDTLRAYAEEIGYITADHILLSTMDATTGEALSGNAAAEKRELAEQILSRLDAGEDFTALADQYSEDPGRASSPEGYTFTHGEMVEEFENAAFALKEGEHSGIVESAYGYHIILRRPLSDEGVEAVRESYFNDFIKREIETVPVRTNPVLDSMDIQALYNAVNAQ